MTICIASMCEGGIIFGAADRLKTAADIQFEPPTRKIYQLTTSIVILTAGDAAFQAEILSELWHLVNDRIQKNPNKWLNIKEVSELYINIYNLKKLQRAENKLLMPLGLTAESFLDKQSRMSESVVNRIVSQMIDIQLPDVGAIIAGKDENGAHIYEINNDEIACFDTIGFSSIGIGSRHATSQFMLAGHSSFSPLPETLLLTYTAKKRSEISPGVGKETDMFMIGPALGTAVIIKPEVIKDLNKVYKKIINGEIKLLKSAKNAVTSYVDEIVKSAITKEQTIPSLDASDHSIKPPSTSPEEK